MSRDTSSDLAAALKAPATTAPTALTRDEEIVLQAYRAVRDQKRGAIFIEFNGGTVQRFDVKPDYGSPQVLNLALKENSEE